MKQNNVTSLRDMLELLSTQQLDAMLSMELSKNQVDADAIRIILDVLYQREKGNEPEITPETRAAFEAYRSEIRKISGSTSKLKRLGAWSVKAASLAAACFLVVMLIPQRAEADSLLESLIAKGEEFEALIEEGELAVEDLLTEIAFTFLEILSGEGWLTGIYSCNTHH